MECLDREFSEKTRIKLAIYEIKQQMKVWNDISSQGVPLDTYICQFHDDVFKIALHVIIEVFLDCFFISFCNKKSKNINV